jgi:hypothetical protein
MTGQTNKTLNYIILCREIKESKNTKKIKKFLNDNKKCRQSA